MAQPPGDGHGQLRFMLHIGRRSEKMASALVAAPSGEQHDARAPVNMVLVSLSNRPLGAGVVGPIDPSPDKELRTRIKQQSERYARFLQRLDLTEDERAAVAADETAARLVQSMDRGEHQPAGDSGIP